MIRRIFFAAIALAAAPAAAQSDGPLSINLTCTGAGEGREMVRNHFKSDEDDPNYVFRNKRVDGVVQVRIRGNTGEVFVPPAYSVFGEWLEMKRMTVTDDTISGRIQVALLTSSQVTIDRISGTLMMKGDNGHFTGRCIAADPNKRAF